MIEFRTFGAIDLRDPGNGAGLDAILSRSKRVALLSYLALARPRGFQRRDSLFLLFWPDAELDRARRALNQSAYVLRKALGGDVLVSRGDDELGVDTSRIWCDAVAFEQHLESGEPEAALQLYDGDLLKGFHLSDCPDFERWLDAERVAYRRKALPAALDLAAGFEERGNVTEAAHWLRRASGWAPYEEPLILELLTLLGRHGDRAGATREYEAFARRLSEDLGLEPSPEATDLIGRIQVNGLSTRRSILLGQPRGRMDAKPSFSAAPRRRWSVVVAGLAVAIALAAGGRLLTGDANLPSGLQPGRLMVATFASEMAADAPVELGTVASNRVAEALTKSGLVEVVPPSESTRWRRILIAEGYAEDDPAIVRATAERAGARLLVTGSYAILTDSVYFHTRVLDVRRGTLLRSSAVVVGTTKAPQPSIERLADRVVGAVGTVVDPRFESWSGAATLPRDMASYRAYSRGVDEWRDRNWTTSAQTFLDLARSDSSFTAALVWAASSRLAAWEGREHLDREAEAALDSVLDALAPVQDGLPGWERSMLVYLQAARRFDNPGAHLAMRDVVENGPAADFVLLLAGITRTLDRPRETQQVLDRVDPSALERDRHRWLYWVHYLWAHHRLGEYERELEVVRSLKTAFPETNWVYGIEVRALAALGREDDMLDRFEVLYRGRGKGRAGVLQHELAAHGYRALADRIERDQLAVIDAVPESERDEAWKYERGLLLEAVIGVDQAIAQIEGIEPDSPRWMDARAARGYYAALQGDTALALQIIEELEDIPQTGYRWNVQARIAAELGEKERAVALLRRMTSPTRGVMHREVLFPSLVGYEPFEELERPRG